MKRIVKAKGNPLTKEDVIAVVYKLFWIYVVCGTAGFLIETLWCWIDFREFSSRTSNLFFPISCVWGGGGGMFIYLMTVKNHWNHLGYIFLKCTFLGAAFEFFCGYLGEHLLEVTFWDYSGRPFHIGKYINAPFCLVWGLIGVIWVRKIYPSLNKKLESQMESIPRFAMNLFLFFMIFSQIITGTALLRMHERQKAEKPGNYIDYLLDYCFTDQVLQKYFPKMKSTVTGEKIYIQSERRSLWTQ